MKWRDLKKHKNFIGIALFLVAWVFVITFVTSPEEIVEVIGVETGYLFVFLTALIGVSSFTSVYFYATLLTLASTGEFNPFLLALTAAPANTLGDMVFFLFGMHSRSVLSEVLRKRMHIIISWVERLGSRAAFGIAYVYTGFTPLPQDFLMVILGAGGASMRATIPAVLLGNFTFITMISFAAQYI